MARIGWLLWPVMAGLFLGLLSAPAAASYGKSVEDLIGVFSIQKSIKIGDSACLDGQNGSLDPLSDQSNTASEAAAAVDSSPPELIGFDLEPKIIDTGSSAQTIKLEAHIVDDHSGLKYGAGGSANVSCIQFISPSGSQTVRASFGPFNLSSGRLLDGIYSSRLILPEQSEPGAWMMESLVLVDEMGNSIRMDRDDMIRHGFPSEFIISG